MKLFKEMRWQGSIRIILSAYSQKSIKMHFSDISHETYEMFEVFKKDLSQKNWYASYADIKPFFLFKQKLFIVIFMLVMHLEMRKTQYILEISAKMDRFLIQNYSYFRITT